MQNSEERAWAAGFFDGEGSTGIWTAKFKNRKKNEYKYLRVQLSQSELTVLERFRSAVGIGVINGPYKYKSRLSKKVFWKYCATNKDAETVVEILWPYLSKPKKEQIKAARKGLE